MRPGSKVVLARDFDPSFKGGIKKKKDGVELLNLGVTLLSEYQARLAAQNTWAVLVVLQALDAAGKDGTIRHVMSGVNPAGSQRPQFQGAVGRGTRPRLPVAVGPAAPGAGEIGIFNRSHYEEVLVVRVHPEALDREKLPQGKRGNLWKRRYQEINDWERYLVDNGIRIVKLFLNLSRKSSGRFLRRLDLPDHNWKFS